MASMSDAAFSSDESHDSAPRGALPAPIDEKRTRTLVLMPAPAPRDETPRWSEARFADAPPEEPPTGRVSGRWRAAASLAAIVLFCAAAAAQIHIVSTERRQTRALDRRLDAIVAQLHALDANRPHDDLASLKKSLADIKASAASAHDLGGAVGQLTARVDRLEKDQSNHLDRLDRDSTQRLAEIAQRLEKLEAKATAAVVAKTEVPKAAPGVSLETTGAIEKPKPRLRNFYLADIRNGYAMIGGPEGEFAVAPGDNVPGGGRVLRIERHGRDWVVVTTLGQIASVDN
jgi:hypothetical protein